MIVDALVSQTEYCRLNRFRETPAQLRDRVNGSLGLLIQFLAGDDDFGDLYTGQRIFELTCLDHTREQNLEYCRRAVTEDERVLVGALSPRVSESDLEAFKDAFKKITYGLVAHAARHVRTLFIGDCLLLEVMSFIVGPLLREGISIEPFPINPRTPGQLKRILEDLATKEFDVVFFSPFSHARVAELEALVDLRRTFAPRSQNNALVDSIIEQTKLLLDDIVARFECPIFIHNAGLVVRATGSLKTAARLLLTHRARNIAGDRINRWLADYVTTANSITYQHLFIIDETSLVRQFGRRVLGKYLNASAYQHPIVFSQRLAQEYCSRIIAVGHLIGKKLVICDLDNTLWDGVIGEGFVTHFQDRQRILKRLKEHCGVVLSIASKNDPANVHFKDGILLHDDFVAPQISWGQKSNSIANIKRTLNLQTKHMVFLDDRPDERAMAYEAFPDILVLDPTKQETWKRIDIWADMIYGSSDVDRTKLYQDQSFRDKFTEMEGNSAGVPDSDALKKLGLVITIGTAKRGELKRVAELINRTNQWNLCGSRTSFEQVRAWHDSPDTLVLVANVADRFGEMGTVCVSIVSQGDNVAEIPVFVLSCRVFGYGIESAMLVEIVRRCEIGGRRAVLIGHFRSNTQNHPCRNMYIDHGFVSQSGAFMWAGSPALPEIPWAEVRRSS